MRAGQQSLGAAVVLSLKPDLDWRFCLDFRGLNAVTVRDVYPMPNMEQVLSSLHGAKYMSSLDMEQGSRSQPSTENARRS